MKQYTIKQNTHSSKLFGFLPHFGFTLKNRLCFSAMFNKDCLYDLYSVDNYDTNKLIGMSTSYNHMIQSARFGWRCLDGKNIEIMTFVHDEGKFLNPQVIGTVKPGEWFYGDIAVNNLSFDFTFNKDGESNIINIPIKTKGWKFKYLLFSYFGGNQVAPHNMNILIKRY